MKQILYFTMLLCFALPGHAQWGKKIKGNGNRITTEREVGTYEGISLSGWFEVILVEGEEGRLSIRGEENLLEYLETEVDKGILKIKTRRGYNLKPSSWKEGIQITVPVMSISELNVSGSGDITSRTHLKTGDFEVTISGSGDIKLELDADKIEAGLTGSGDLTLKGRASSLEVRVSGSGDVEAGDLEADKVDVVISGSADVVVYARDYLKARVSGSGDVTYRGNPRKTDTKVSGSGEVRKM